MFLLRNFISHIILCFFVFSNIIFNLKVLESHGIGRKILHDIKTQFMRVSSKGVMFV